MMACIMYPGQWTGQLWMKLSQMCCELAMHLSDLWVPAAGNLGIASLINIL
jgi:hypothetical protein